MPDAFSNYLSTWMPAGYAPGNALFQAAPQVGSQAAPLNYFYGAGGSGNKTTNKDLPQWLRDAGMKGDAYAGGMLKPALRYGFLYKNGKIHFADGTSFDAKKVKDKETKQITYQYTGADGTAKVYDPTDEQDLYNRKYQNATANQSFVEKLGATYKRTSAHVGDVLEGARDALRGEGSYFGGTPLGTKLSNAITGDDVKPVTDQYGGPTEESQRRYVEEHGEGALGYQPQLHALGSAIASMYAGQYAGAQLGQLGASTGGVTSGASTGTGWGGAGTANSGLGVFGNGGAGGLAGVGGGNAGALAASGAITGGAGVAGLGNLGGLGSTASAGTGGGMAWGDWVNLGLQLYGSYAQGEGARDAARAQVAGSEAGIAEQRRQFDLSRADQMPWLMSGVNALGRLNDPTAFTTSPSYNFIRGEALGGVQNSAAARGGLFSGNAGRALQDRAANVASQEYNNWFNQNASLAGLGQSSAQSLGGLGQNSANNISNLLGQQGNARASGIAGQTNALTGGISDFLSWYNRGGYGR